MSTCISVIIPLRYPALPFALIHADIHDCIGQSNDHRLRPRTGTGQRHDLKADLIAVVTAVVDNQPVVLTIGARPPLIIPPLGRSGRNIETGCNGYFFSLLTRVTWLHGA